VLVEVLGPVRVWHDEQAVDLGPVGQRALLGLLALNLGEPLSRAELVEALWGRRPPTTAANVLQTRIKLLRRLLEPDRPRRAPSRVLPVVGDGYALRLHSDALDLGRFRALTVAAGEARRAGDADRESDLLRRALELWRGVPLADVPSLTDNPLVVSAVEEHQVVLSRYGELMVASGRADEALPALERAAANRELDEAAHARLIRAYHAAGRRGQAFATYHAVRRRLADDLGVVPGPELTSAHAALLHGDADTTRPPPRVTTVPSQLPADVPGFTGRSAELAELDDCFSGPARDAVVVAALSGTAGVGKTALALHWAHQRRDRFPDGQLYVDLRGYDSERPLAAADVLVRFLGALGVTGPDVPLDTDDRAARYRTETAGRRMLVVLDNAGSVEQVRPLLPGSASCGVLVTSRDSLVGLVALHGARRVDLDLLPVPDATALLRYLIGARVDAEPDAILTLAEQCARLPLALRVAAELAAGRPTEPVSDLVAELADRRHRLELLDAGGDDRAAVRVVFSRSYEQLPPDTARAFRLLGLHPGPHVDAHSVAALTGTTAQRGRLLLDQLTRAHLTQPADSGRCTVHDLLRAYAVHLTGEHDSPAQRHTALTGLFDHYVASTEAAMLVLHSAPGTPAPPPEGVVVVPVPDSSAARAWLESELPTLTAVCAHTAGHGWPGHTSRLAAVLQPYLDGGRYAEALVVHTHALRAAVNRGDRAAAHANLGIVLWRLGRYQEAARELDEALALYRELGDRGGEARALSNLGIVDERQGRYDSAAGYQARALAIYREVGDALGEVHTHGNLGIVDERQGRYDSAIEHLRRALALCRRAGYRSGEAYTLLNLGHVHLRTEQHGEAAEHFDRALAQFREIGDSRGECYALTGLGDVERREGRWRRAVDSLSTAVTLFRELGERRGEAHALNGLGEALSAAGRDDEARTRHGGALELAVDTGDQDEQARAHAGLARAHQAAGDDAAAREQWELALELYVELGDPAAETVRAALVAP
jgi:tetratricopeptide (TPR) repeat protein